MPRRSSVPRWVGVVSVFVAVGGIVAMGVLAHALKRSKEKARQLQRRKEIIVERERQRTGKAIENELILSAKAGEAFKEAVAYARENPDDIDGILRRYQRIVDMEAGRWSKEASTQILRMRSARERKANELYSELKKKADNLVQQRKFRQAMELLRNFPSEYGECRVASKIPKDIAEIKRKAVETYKVVEVEAEALRQQGRLEEARALYLNAGREFGVEDIVKTALENATDIERELAERSLSRFCEAVDELARELSFDRAILKAESFPYSDHYPELGRKLKWRIRALKHLKAFLKKLVDAPVPSELVVVLRQKNGFPITGKLQSLNSEEVVLRLRGGSTVKVKWETLTPRAINELASKVLAESKAESAFSAGLLAIFTGELQSAGVFIRLARRLGYSPQDSDFFLDVIQELWSERGDEMLSQVKTLITQEKWREALSAITELRKKLAGSTFLEAKEEELKELEEKCEEFGGWRSGVGENP